MIGRTFTTATLLTSIPPTDAPIIGEDSGSPYGALRIQAGAFLSADIGKGDSGDAGNLAAFTIELWVRPASVAPGADQVLVAGPMAASPVTELRQYFVGLDTTGQAQWSFLESGGGTEFLQSGTLLKANEWQHLVCAYGANVQRIYINGAQTASAAAGGTPFPEVAPVADFRLSDSGNTVQIDYDEVAFYRHELPAARVAAHYQAGVSRGFPSQTSGARIQAVLDAAESHAPRNIQTGARTLTARYMVGQPPLNELKSARSAEAVDAMLFVARDGTITFLDSTHRASSPYNTVQATFDDDGTDLPYIDLTMDYSEAFLFNDWSVTRQGPDAVTQTAEDAASINRRRRRPESLVGIPVTTDAQALDVAEDMLAKYKEPMRRVTGLTLLTNNPAVAEAAFRRDLGDRIRVFRTPMGGGARIDQTVFIQKIDVASLAGRLLRVKWAVSPV